MVQRRNYMQAYLCDNIVLLIKKLNDGKNDDKD